MRQKTIDDWFKLFAERLYNLTFVTSRIQKRLTKYYNETFRSEMFVFLSELNCLPEIKRNREDDDQTAFSEVCMRLCEQVPYGLLSSSTGKPNNRHGYTFFFHRTEA